MAYGSSTNTDMRSQTSSEIYQNLCETGSTKTDGDQNKVDYCGRAATQQPLLSKTTKTNKCHNTLMMKNDPVALYLDDDGSIVNV